MQHSPLYRSLLLAHALSFLLAHVVAFTLAHTVSLLVLGALWLSVFLLAHSVCAKLTHKKGHCCEMGVQLFSLVFFVEHLI